MDLGALTIGETNSLSPLDGAVRLHSTSRSATGALPFFGLVDASLRPGVEGLHTAGLEPGPLYYSERLGPRLVSAPTSGVDAVDGSHPPASIGAKMVIF